MQIIDAEDHIIKFSYVDEKVQKYFNFGFRYYNSYTGGYHEQEGVYTFKTTDADSMVYNLKLIDIQTHIGVDETSTMLLRY